MSHPEHTYLELSTTTILRGILWIALGYLLYLIRDIFLLILVAFIISSGVMIASRWLKKKTLFPYEIGVVMIFTIIFGFVSTLVALILPELLTQLQGALQDLPQFVKNVESMITAISQDRVSNASEIFPKDINLVDYVRVIGSGVFFTTGNVLFSLINFLFFIALTGYLALRPKSIDTVIMTFFPKHYHRTVRIYVEKSRLKVGNWILGQMILAFVVGILAYIAFLVIGVPYSLLLAVIVALFNMVPMLGPILSFFPAVLFALTADDPLTTVVYVGIFYTIIQQLDGQVLTPLILNRVTGISAIVIVFAVLVGTTFAGVLGAIICVPIVSVISLFVDGLTQTSQKVYPKRTLVTNEAD